MIIVFPLLTDESISPNIMPGLCKTLEKFILIYQLDAIMKMTGSRILAVSSVLVGSATSLANAGFAGMRGAVGAGGLTAKTKRESLNIISEVYDPDKEPQYHEYVKDPKFKDKIAAGDTWKWDHDIWAQKNKDKVDDTRFSMDMEKYWRDRRWTTIKNATDTMKVVRDLGSVKYEMPLNNTLAIEPTYFTAQTTTGTKLIGIKVIPIPIKSKEGYSLAEVLAHESSFSLIETLLTSMKRKIIRLFWAACRGLHIPLLSDRVITGDPTKDILWASTFHRRYVYCLLNLADVQSDFFRNAGGVHKLHKLQWNSFIIADEVNKKAIFCMREFHGLCSSVPYSFVMSSLGREQEQAYEKLEDVKKSVSPFFKTKVPEKRVFESVEYTKIQDYLNKIQ
jgi:hypothetical protein